MNGTTRYLLMGLIQLFLIFCFYKRVSLLCTRQFYLIQFGVLLLGDSLLTIIHTIHRHICVVLSSIISHIFMTYWICFISAVISCRRWPIDFNFISMLSIQNMAVSLNTATLDLLFLNIIASCCISAISHSISFFIFFYGDWFVVIIVHS